MAERKDLGGGRGLGRYGDPVADTYFDQSINGSQGSIVTVQDSSAAEYDAAWLRISGTAHVGEDVEIEEYSPSVMLGDHRIPATRIVKGDISAHLNIKKAKRIRDALDAWIKRVEG